MIVYLSHSHLFGNNVVSPPCRAYDFTVLLLLPPVHQVLSFYYRYMATGDALTDIMAVFEVCACVGVCVLLCMCARKQNPPFIHPIRCLH